MKYHHNIGLKGHLPNLINIFLANRNFDIRLGSTISDNFEQEMGVPQGSILSVTLFSTNINSLAEVLSDDMHGSFYVDDFVLCYKSKNMNSVKGQLHFALTKFKTGPMRMVSNFQKLKLLASIFVPYVNLIMLHAYI